MKNIHEKISEKKGESLTETLTGAFLAGLALLILITMLLSARQIMENEQARIANLYGEMNRLEQQSGEYEERTVVIEGGRQSVETTVRFYESDEGMAAYAK